jgi:hypothetical protein
MARSQTTGTHPRQSRRIHRRLSAPASAVALAMLLAGNVSGAQLVREDTQEPLVTPRLSRPLAALQLQFKLATHAGRTVLERG